MNYFFEFSANFFLSKNIPKIRKLNLKEVQSFVGDSASSIKTLAVVKSCLLIKEQMMNSFFEFHANYFPQNIPKIIN